MTDPAARIDWRRPDYADVWAARLERVARLEKAPAADLAALRAYYANHPADFITDWGMTFDPRNPERGLPAMAPFILFPKQREAVEWLVARWKNREDGLVEKSRDMGVSWLCVAVAAWMWTFHPGVVVGFGSRKEDYVDRIGDPSSLFWKIRAFIRLLPPFFRPKDYNEDKHAPFMRVLNPENGAAIIGEAGSNIGRGARTSVYFKDESAFYEQPESIDAALSQTSNCKIDISTPNGEGNPFWRKRMGGKLPVFVFDWRDDPRKGQDWYDKQRRKLDPVVLAQEVDRDYSASIGNSYIPSDLVTDAMGKGPAEVVPMGGLRFGLDVARFGDDKTVLTIRKGRLVLRQSVWGKTDLMSTAGRVRQEMLAYRAKGQHVEQIAVDTIGIGAGVADALRQWFPDEGVIVDVNSAAKRDDGENYNLRAYMWQQMRDWLGTAALPNDPELRADLTGLRYGFRSGLLLLESKDDAKKRGMKSPDRADSLALTFAVPGGPKAKPTIPRSAVVTYGIDDEMGL
jgi:phage terminase large subunit